MGERVGVVLASDDPERLYVAATYVATELAMGKEVVIFAAGRSVLALAGRGGAGGPYYEKMKELKVDWQSLLKASKPLGLKIVACETALRIYGVSPDELDKELVDAVSSMYTFLEEVGNGRVVAF